MDILTRMFLVFSASFWSPFLVAIKKKLFTFYEKQNWVLFQLSTIWKEEEKENEGDVFKGNNFEQNNPVFVLIELTRVNKR